MNNKKSLFGVFSYHEKHREFFKLIDHPKSIFNSKHQFTAFVVAFPYTDDMLYKKPTLTNNEMTSHNQLDCMYSPLVDKSLHSADNLCDKSIKGYVERFAFGVDYHKLVLSELEVLSRGFAEKNNLDIHKSKSFVDISPYSDREIAFYAGLGSFGKNHMLMNEEFGSRFFIGYTIFDEYIEKFSILGDNGFLRALVSLDEESRQRVLEFNLCKQCNLCVKDCPSRVCGVRNADMTKCISGISQNKNKLSPNEMKLLGDRIYGCGICQDVCPANKLLPESEESYLDCYELIGMSSKMFKKKYSEHGFAWLPHWVFVRGAIINIGNLGDLGDIPRLIEFGKILIDRYPERDFLYYIDWAIAQIKNRFEMETYESKRVFQAKE